jgi:hypothetical protein
MAFERLQLGDEVCWSICGLVWVWDELSLLLWVFVVVAGRNAGFVMLGKRKRWEDCRT